MSELGRLAGKRALVTGAGTGIGREIALEFAREGADVALHYSRSAEGASSAADAILAMGRRACAVQADFGSTAAVSELARRAIEYLGGVDCLVNNAGITFNRPFLEVTEEQFETLFTVNVRGQFILTQHIVRDMLGRGHGVICNLTSIHGLQGAPEHSVYAGTKGAIIAHTRALAVELGHQGIRVNAIAPGCVVVENYAKAIPGFRRSDADAMARNAIPLGRVGLPLDIARLAAFLCSDAAELIMGQILVADGGTTALMSLVSDFRMRSNCQFGTGYIAGV